MTRIDVRRLTSASGLRWLAATVLAVTASAVYYFVTGPAEDRPYTIAVPVVLLVALACLARQTTWIDVTDREVLLVRRGVFRTRRVDVATARVELRASFGGQAQLVVKDDRASIVLVLHISTIYVRAYQPAAVLEPLIEGLERNRRIEVPMRKHLVGILREQLAHVRAGGPVATAPLQGLAVDVTGAIAGVGAAGAATRLLD